MLFNYSFICHLSLKYPSLALSNQSRTLHINTEKVLQIMWLRSCLWSQLVRFLKHEHNVQAKPPTKCLILLKSLMLQLSPSVFFTSVPERDVPTFWAFLPHMEAEPHTTTGVQKLAQFWFGYKSNRSSMDPYRKKNTRKRHGVHFGVSNEHNIIKYARPNKHKKEITRHCHNRKHAWIQLKLELAGKYAIVTALRILWYC